MNANDFVITTVVTNDKLNELMAKVRGENTEDNVKAVLNEVAVSKFIVPVSVSEAGVSLHAVGNSKGETYMVVFSDTETYETNTDKDKRYGVISSFEDIIDAVVNNPSIAGFVINPGVEEVLFGKDMLEMIARQMGIIGDNGATAKVGEPDHYPERLHEMLNNYLMDEKKVSKIWVRLMRVSEDSVMWLLVVEAKGTVDEKKYICNTLKSFIKPYLDGLDVIVADSEDPDVIPAIATVKPYIENV